MISDKQEQAQAIEKTQLPQGPLTPTTPSLSTTYSLESAPPQDLYPAPPDLRPRGSEQDTISYEEQEQEQAAAVDETLLPPAPVMPTTAPLPDWQNAPHQDTYTPPPDLRLWGSSEDSLQAMRDLHEKLLGDANVNWADDI